MKALALLLVCVPALADLRSDAQHALNRSTQFIRSISTHGGYLWWYSADLKERAGETKATESQVWVQPPGTPAMGQAFLRAYRATKDRAYLDAATAAADALAYGQLDSGGWHYMIDFDEKTNRYLRRSIAAAMPEKERVKRRNVTTFDDNNTQSCVMFLLALSQATQLSDKIQSTLDYALEKMLAAQYPNGTWERKTDSGETRTLVLKDDGTGTFNNTAIKWTRSDDVLTMETPPGRFIQMMEFRAAVRLREKERGIQR